MPSHIYALLLSHIVTVLTFKSVFRMLTAVNSYQNCPSFSRGGFRHLASIEICFVVIRLVSADLLSVFTNASDWPAPFKANDAFYLDVYLGAVHSSQSAGGNNKKASMNVHVYTHVVHFSAKSDIYKDNHIYHKIYNRAFVNIFYFFLNYFLMIMILVYDILWLNCNHLPAY